MQDVMTAQSWLRKGQMIAVNGHKVFVVSPENTEKDLPHLVILHGYPTCGYDYYKVLPLLAQHFRVVVHDHLGFGFSDKPKNYSYTLIDQCDTALQLWQHLAIKKAHVLAHDYGTSVATELVARFNHGLLPNFDIQSLTLCNGSMHIELARLRLIQRLLLNRLIGPVLARLSSKNTLARNIKRIYHDSSAVCDQEIDALWEMMTYKQGKQVIHQTTQYIKQRKQFWHRWIGALQQTSLPIHVLWAENDPIAVLEMAQVLHAEIQNSVLTQIQNAGHFPMLEVPEVWSNSVLDYLLKA